MPRIQELIHSLESGLLGRAVSVAALLLAVVTMAVVFDLREFQNFKNEEAMDVSQVARNLAEGRGFTTRYIRPLSMGMVMRHGGERDPQIKGEHPDLAPPALPDAPGRVHEDSRALRLRNRFPEGGTVPKARSGSA